MTHTFAIIFADGEHLRLLADFDHVPVRFTANDKAIANRHPVEYRAWLNDVVAPEVTRLSSPSQMLAAVQIGVQVIDQTLKDDTDAQ